MIGLVIFFTRNENYPLVLAVGIDTPQLVRSLHMEYEPEFANIYKTMPRLYCQSLRRELFLLLIGQRAENSLGGVITGEIAYHFVRSDT